jgi:CRP-like cAMP-binding protein
MNTMIPLRIVGITSNVTFMSYAWLASFVPLFVLHTALLPLNIWRLMQIRALIREVRKVAIGDLPLDRLLPFMTARRVAAGEVLFRRGDVAGEMFHVLSGAVRLAELDKTLGPGALLGEISMFAPRRERTTTAVCDTEVELLSITADRVMQLYYQNPRFGCHVVRLITGRLIENLRRDEPVAAADAGPARSSGSNASGASPSWRSAAPPPRRGCSSGDGMDPDWNDRSRDDLRRDTARTAAELAEAEATLTMSPRPMPRRSSARASLPSPRRRAA